MEKLTRQVRRAQRRLALAHFLGALGWCWFVTLLGALAIIVVDRFRPLGPPVWSWATGAMVLGLLVACVWTWMTRHRSFEAAVELDRRLALKERVSSTLALSASERETEAGRALLADATRRVERVDVAGAFPIILRRRFLLPVLPGVAALLVALLVNQAVVENPAQAKPSAPKVEEQIKKSTDVLRKRLAEGRKKAEELEAPEAEAVLKSIEGKIKEIDSADRKEALAKLKDLSSELAAQREKRNAVREVQRQLENLAPAARGPADALAKALQNGDFGRAAEELGKLQQQMAEGKLPPGAQEPLAKQLDQLKEAMDKMAQARDAAKQNLEQQIKQLREAGREEEAKRLEQQRDRLQQQMPQLQKLDQLANELGQCAKCLREGNGREAQQAMQQMQQGLNELGQQLQEMELMDEAMDELADMRQQLQDCPDCGGRGCKQCNGNGFGNGQGQEGANRQSGGRGWGRGTGRSLTDPKDYDGSLYDSRVRQKVGRGKAFLSGEIGGPNAAGRVQSQINADVEAAKEGNTDPLTDRRLPRRVREHAQEYFDGIREGK